MTQIMYNSTGQVEVIQNGARIATLELSAVCALDSDLRDTCAHAMECRGSLVPVPTKTFAKGVRARNYGALGVQL